MKKGFTLVELLAVLVILAVILAITTFSVRTIIVNSKNSLYDVQVKKIEKAAEAYYIKEGMDSGINAVGVALLIDRGYLDNSVVNNPKTNERMGGYVRIDKKSNHYEYRYIYSDLILDESNPNILDYDYDNNSVVDGDDILYLLYHINFSATYPVDPGKKTDVNEDGVVDFDDAIDLCTGNVNNVMADGECKKIYE